ncbi:MAG: selenide, water dikinase SelD, partial [Nitrospirota bacterium]
MPDITDPNVLVGAANADDAGVYRFSDDFAVVFTADFFTPIVDDPYWYGAIAAANSLSDVYAMGGKPIASLNIAMFPSQPEFFPYLKKIMQGGIDKMSEAGVPIIGGHTIRDREPKFGFAVLGTIKPDMILDNTKARVGDSMILTKKIGTGVVSTGIKAGMCGEAAVDEITRSMAMLNRRASEIMLEVGVSTATDITGFGLIGHMYEVLSASKRTARVYAGRVPFFDEAIRLADLDKVPGGTRTNQANFSSRFRANHAVTQTEIVLLNDAQTSGGLLIFVPGGKKEKLISSLQREDIPASYIGDVVEANVD